MSSRGGAVIIFILIATAIYGLAHFYVLRRGWRALDGTGAFRAILLVLTIACAILFFAGRAIVLRHPGAVTGVLAAVGYWYLAFFIYLLFLTLAVDLVRLIDAFFPFFPEGLRSARTGGRLAFALVFGTAFVATIAGTVHALKLHIRTTSVVLTKPAGSLTSLNAVLFADVHLSPMHRTPFLDRIVDAAAALSPDIVFIAGDLFSEDTPESDIEAIAASLRRLRPRFGTFACLGNHEVFGGLDKARTGFRLAGITLLEDEAVLVGDAFYVAGRKDPQAGEVGKRRMPLFEILADLDKSHPVILLDHQPIALKEAEGAGVDLQLSGHTHDGQLFPVNIINSWIYEHNWGPLSRGKTQFDVTSGAGTWGPPVRLGSTSEIVLLKVRFGAGEGDRAR